MLGYLEYNCIFWFYLLQHWQIIRGRIYHNYTGTKWHSQGCTHCCSCNGTEPIQIAKGSVLQAHCTNLCPQAVGRRVTPVSDVLDLAMEVGQLIRFLPKRSSLFQSMQFQLLCDIPSLKPLCPTWRTIWTSATQSVITNYEVLCDTLCEISEGGRDEYAIKAGGILEKISTYYGLKLSHLITEQLSLSLPNSSTLRNLMLSHRFQQKKMANQL